MNPLPSVTDADLCERLMHISRAVTDSTDWKRALDEILPELRPVLIFDNLAVFTASDDPQTLEVVYARAMGRGKSLEAEIAWGENLASQVYHKRVHLLETPSSQPDADRNQMPFMMGLPIMDQDKCLGTLILIRFGGPVFTRKDERLAGFLVAQIAILLQRQALLHQVEILNILRQQAMLQDSFVSMISHELRHPLGFIKGYVTTLLRKEIAWDPNTQNEFLQIIDQETDQLLEIIDNMLDSARLQSGHLQIEFQPVRMDSLLEGVITQSRNYYPDTIIHLQKTSGLFPVSGDPRRLGQVFYNLINNAHKYAPGSDIWVTISKGPIEGEDQKGLLVKVKDNGPGIPEQYLPHIFERFFRNPDQNPNIHGSGLGLYICKQIVELHGGTITAESIPGQGTAIRVFIPYDQPN